MWEIIAGIVLLIAMVYLRISVIIAAPLSVTLVALLSGYSPLPILTSEYVEGVGYFIEEFIFIFLLGAILGKIMSDSGAASTIAYYITRLLGARRGTTAVLISSALLAYGGVPGFVLVFSIYPISLPLFRKANLPRYLLPACISGGIANLALTMPGSPQVHNVIPMEFLGTGPLAGFFPGMAGASVSFFLAMGYLELRAFLARKKAQDFVSPEPGEDGITGENNLPDPGIFKSILPLLIVVTTLTLGGFPVILALFSGVVAGLILFYGHLGSLLSSINQGVRDSLTPLLFAASAVGFGLTLRSFPDFAFFLEGLMEQSWDPLFTSGLITNLGAGIMGSASGGIVLTMSLASEEMLQHADPSSLHRVIVMSSSVLDTVPYNNGYLAILAFTGLSFKDTYLDFLVSTVIFPLIGLAVAVMLFL